jgi:ABC-type amino acid transport substrate-binding protein
MGFLCLSPAFAAEKESAFDRVIRTGVLRCGYWNWAPLFSVDTQTGKYSGIFYELTEYMGKSLGLKIEWTKEVGFASFEQDLLSGKVDAVCAGVWPKAARSKVEEFSNPVFYVPLQIYVRAGDKRFDKDLETLNAPEITFSGMDGLAEAAVVAQDFPKAKRVSLPDTASVSETFLVVQEKKADAVVSDLFTGQNYMKNNPDVLRAVKSDRPLRYFGNTISVNKGEQKLVNMINVALEEAHSAGVVEKILKKYEAVPNSLLRVAKPYKEVQ